MFTGVSWHGDSSQISVIGQALDYWENVTNASKSSAALASAVNSLPGSTKVSAAHSLGNMVVSSAIKDHGMGVSKHFFLTRLSRLKPTTPQRSALIRCGIQIGELRGCECRESSPPMGY